MFDFEIFLRDLVFENRRVIIPELGAFLLKEEPATQKSIIFSSFLRYNDGFLESSLIEQSGMSTNEAAKTVKEYVDTINKVLESGRDFEINGLGRFSKDGKGAIQFIFDNVESEPISSFSSTPVQNPFLGRSKTTIEYNHREVQRSSKKWIYITLVILLLLVLIGFIYVFVLSKLHENPIGSVSSQSSPVVVTEPKREDVDHSTAPVPATVPATSSQSPIYHVIGGCFSDKINADRFVEECRENGFKDAEILPKMGDLIPVSIMQLSSRREAERKKEAYNEKYDEEAWVYRTY